MMLIEIIITQQQQKRQLIMQWDHINNALLEAHILLMLEVITIKMLLMMMKIEGIIMMMLTQ